MNYSIYVVWGGPHAGIYKTWEECEKACKGFRNCISKGFHSLEEAVIAFKMGSYWAYLSSIRESEKKQSPPDLF